MKPLALAAALLASAACAHAPGPASGSVPEPELKFVTGSRIPQRLDASGTIGTGSQQLRVIRYRPGAAPDIASMMRNADPALRTGAGG